jgi:ATP-dependent exoDNAse (exonuclease V) beta subunit
MVNKGYTFISRDVTVNGTIDVTTSDGNTIQVNVAGTVDLLAYDSQGNWHLFDMKTYRSKMDANKKKKYARQLTLYKQLLENKYGIQINTMSILPIHVEYSDVTRYETSQESKHEKYNGS